MPSDCSVSPLIGNFFIDQFEGKLIRGQHMEVDTIWRAPVLEDLSDKHALLVKNYGGRAIAVSGARDTLDITGIQWCYPQR